MASLALFASGHLAGAHGQGVAPCESDPIGGPTTGTPSSPALQSALAKQAQIAKSDGPWCVVLSAAEMASIIAAGLDPRARRALAIHQVRLDSRGRLTLEGEVDTEVLAEALGPLLWMLNPHEPISVVGPVRSVGAGYVAWEPDGFIIRSLPLPELAVPRLVNYLTGRTDGIVPIRVPKTVEDVRITSRGVIFYRASFDH